MNLITKSSPPAVKETGERIKIQVLKSDFEPKKEGALVWQGA